MEKQQKWKMPEYTVIIIVIVVFAAVEILWASNQINKSFYDERAINSTRIMERISQNIDNVMQNRWDDLHYVANQICDFDFHNQTEIFQQMVRIEGYLEEGNHRLILIDSEGNGYLSDGVSFKWLNKDVLRINEDVLYIDNIDILEEDFDQILFATSLPENINVDDRVFTHIVLECDMNSLDKYFNLSSYGDKSRMYVVRLDGEVIYSDLKNQSPFSFNNVFEGISLCEGKYGTHPEKISEYIQNGESGCVVFNYDNEPYFAIYTPLECNDWYAVFIVPEELVGVNTGIFMQSVFAIVIVSAVILIIALVSLMTIHSRRIKIRQQEVNEQLKRAVEAEKAANDAKTRFISTMSHDMRTPLNAIIGVVTLTSRHINNPKYVKESLDKVSVASKHLLTLVNDILDLSRIESGKLVLNPVEFMLPQMIVNLQNIIKPQIRAKQQVLNMNIHDITHERLFADELRIKQVYMNILTNAVKYTPEGGRIDFELWEKVNVVRTGWIKLFCRVSDNGIGMSNEYMKEMYDMFSRAEDSRISKIQGSGLGLPICKNLVDLMGGTIECESTLGKGTIFKISLDLECFLDDECMLPDDIRYEYGTGNMDLSYINILVAESSNSMWDIIFEMLNHHGVHADRALDGIDCIQKLAASEKGYYSLVIMDTDLDTLDGCRTTKELRKSASEYINSIPVVGIADKTNYMNIIDCMDSGMSSYVEKPVDINNLYREILRFIKRA